jgi:hypothetical protein
MHLFRDHALPHHSGTRAPAVRYPAPNSHTVYPYCFHLFCRYEDYGIVSNGMWIMVYGAAPLILKPLIPIVFIHATGTPTGCTATRA